MPAPDRYHALDALRGSAMLLGIGVHAALPYLHTRVPFWPVRDTHTTLALDVALLGAHDFRMQVFFLLAGFFGALLYTRYGLRKTAIHRFKRIGLPLMVAMLTIQPLLQAVSVYAAADVYLREPAGWQGGDGFAAVLGARETPAGVTAHYFASGTFLPNMIPAHLWFLWYLLLGFAVLLPLARLADRLRDRPVGRAWDMAARWLLRSRLRWLVLAALTWPINLLMKLPAGPDTPLGWMPLWHLLGYYFLFVVVGWTLYRHRDLLPRFAGGWREVLAANLLVLPTVLALVSQCPPPAEMAAAGAGPLGYPLNFLVAVYTWLMVGGLIGLFLRYLSVERPWARWLADSAYWCYLASLPAVVLFQWLAFDWDAPAPVKVFAVTAATLATVLATYRLFVRYTGIGRLLNGPRERAERMPEIRTKAIAASGAR
jgi:glucan biosynthesis protein C